MNYISELSSICESVYKSNGLVVEKKDDEENPFEKKEDTESKDEENNDKTSDDQSDDAEKTDDESTDDGGDSETAEPDGGNGFDGSVFGGTTEGDDQTEEIDDTTNDQENEDIVSGEPDETEEGGVSDEEYRDASDLGVMLLMLATQVHFWHINCRSSGDHNCLGKLYNDLIDETDKLLENIVSVTKNSITAGDEQSFDFGNLEFDKEESISILEDVRTEVDTVVERYADNQGLCNIIGNISECLGTAIYMLSRFES